MPKIKISNKLYAGHTFWSCLIRCIYMKWIQQNWRRYRADMGCGTDRRMEWNQYTPQQLCCTGGINIVSMKEKESLKMSAKWWPFSLGMNVLTHRPCEWWLPYMSSVYWVIIGSGNGLQHVWHQAITWINADLASIGHLETKFTEIWMKQILFKEIRLRISSAKCSWYSGANVFKFKRKRQHKINKDIYLFTKDVTTCYT